MRVCACVRLCVGVPCRGGGDDRYGCWSEENKVMRVWAWTGVGEGMSGGAWGGRTSACACR